MNILLYLTFFVLFLTGCAILWGRNKKRAGHEPNTLPLFKVSDCEIEPIMIPKLPKVIPGYTELDPETGLHMTGSVQTINFSSYRLNISGAVEQPGSLEYDQIRCLPKVTASPPLVCPGFFQDLAAWSGVPIAEVLKLARPLPGAKYVSLVSADGYTVALGLESAVKPENLLAFEWEGQPIPVLHGFPLRAVLPDEDGNSWVKWIVELHLF
jgi:DMSO/TMAO reductase YedYZ molybdopterin-dependent catalytic subunit